MAGHVPLYGYGPPPTEAESSDGTTASSSSIASAATLTGGRASGAGLVRAAAPTRRSDQPAYASPASTVASYPYGGIGGPAASGLQPYVRGPPFDAPPLPGGAGGHIGSMYDAYSGLLAADGNAAAVRSRGLSPGNRFAPVAGPSSPEPGEGLAYDPRQPMLGGRKLQLQRAYDDSAAPATAGDPDQEAHKKRAGDANRAIRKLFADIKLNVRATEIYLRVWRKRLYKYELYRGMVLYFVFVSLFALLAVRIIPVSINYEQNESLIVDGHLDMEEAFESVKDVGDLYGWLADVLLPLTDPANEREGSFRWFRQQVGAVRIRQIRSTPFDCKAIIPGHSKMVDWRCYNDFNPGVEDRSAFPLNDDEWRYRTGMREVEPSSGYLRDQLTGEVPNSYGFGGYVALLSGTSNEQNLNISNELKEGGWLDAGTRAVVIEANWQNPHTNTFVAMAFMVEFPTAGLAMPSVRVDTLHLDTFDRWTVVIAIVFYLAAACYFVAEIIEIFDKGLLEYITGDKWNLLDVPNLVLLFVAGYKGIQYYRFCERMTAKLAHSVDPTRFYDFDEGLDHMSTIQQLAGVSILILCIRSYKYLEFTPRLAILTNTITKAVPDLASFVFIFFILFGGYAAMAFVIFGHRIEEFRTFKSSIANLFGNLSGGFNPSEMAEVSPVAGMIFYFSFIVIMGLVLVNIFIAIVGKYYEEAGVEAVKSEQELLDILSPDDLRSPWSKIARAELKLRVLRRKEDSKDDKQKEQKDKNSKEDKNEEESEDSKPCLVTPPRSEKNKPPPCIRIWLSEEYSKLSSDARARRALELAQSQVKLEKKKRTKEDEKHFKGAKWSLVKEILADESKLGVDYYESTKPHAELVTDLEDAEARFMMDVMRNGLYLQLHHEQGALDGEEEDAFGHSSNARGVSADRKQFFVVYSMTNKYIDLAPMDKDYTMQSAAITVLSFGWLMSPFRWVATKCKGLFECLGCVAKKPDHETPKKRHLHFETSAHTFSIHDGDSLTIPFWAAAKLRLYFYLRGPNVVLGNRIRYAFEAFEMKVPKQMVEDVELEEALMSISRRNYELRKLLDDRGAYKVYTPARFVRRTFALDDMLSIIEALREFAKENKTEHLLKCGEKEENTFQHLVEDAVLVDALYRATIGEATKCVVDLVDKLKTLEPKVKEAGPDSLDGDGEGGVVGRRRAIRLVGGENAILGRAGLKPTFYEHLTIAVNEFDRRVQDLYLTILSSSPSAGGDEADPQSLVIRDSLRFDEVARIVRDITIQKSWGANEIDIKRETLRFLSTLPPQCFVKIDMDEEKNTIWIPRPYDTSDIAKKNGQKLREALRKTKLCIPVLVVNNSNQYGVSSAGDNSAIIGEARKVDVDYTRHQVTLLEALGIAYHDQWVRLRLKDGWKYGKDKSEEGDGRKISSFMTTYVEDKAPGSEKLKLGAAIRKKKEEDIQEALEILYAAMYCGYTFRPPKSSVEINGWPGMPDLLKWTGASQQAFPLYECPKLALKEDPSWKKYVAEKPCLPPNYLLLKVNKAVFKEEIESNKSTEAATAAKEVVSELVQLLASNAHESWASKKKRAGFLYGPDKIRKRRISNRLVPFECLGVHKRSGGNDKPRPQPAAEVAIAETAGAYVDEQAFNQDVVKVVLRLLVACGWEIKPPASWPTLPFLSFFYKTGLQIYHAEIFNKV